MKLVVGMGSLEDYELFVEAGADEIFCGFVPQFWNEKYGNLMPLNRREVFFYHVSMSTMAEMKALREKIEQYKVPVTIAMNALMYSKEQIADAIEVIRALCDLGFTEYIIADVSLLLALHKEKLPVKIHVSGEMGEWNEETIHLFEKEFSISRVIFGRKTTISDMAEMIAKSNLEFEAFFLNENCQFNGSFCNTVHCDELCHMCLVPYELKRKDASREDSVITFYKKHQEMDLGEYENQLESGTGEKTVAFENLIQQELSEEKLEEQEAMEIVGETGCGFCALWDLEKAGVTHLKIVGRGKSPEKMAQDMKASRQALQILEKYENDRTGYCKAMKAALFPFGCSKMCYYRE